MKEKIIYLLLIYLMIIKYLLTFEPNLIKTAQEICHSFLPSDINNTEIWLSLVCGIRPQNRLYALFTHTQLIHLLVVSGTQITILFFPLKNISKTHWTLAIGSITLLLLFAIFSGLEAPVLNAWLLLSLSFIFNKKSTSIILSLILLLIIYFPNNNNWSLYLSLFTTTFLIFIKTKNQNFYIYWGLLPFLMITNNSSPIGIIINFLFANFFSWLLFPIAILCLTSLNLIKIVFDKLAFLILQILTLINDSFFQNLKSQLFAEQQPSFYQWIYLILFISIYYYANVTSERNIH